MPDVLCPRMATMWVNNNMYEGMSNEAPQRSERRLTWKLTPQSGASAPRRLWMGVALLLTASAGVVWIGKAAGGTSQISVTTSGKTGVGYFEQTVPLYEKISAHNCAYYKLVPILDEATCIKAVRYLQLAHGISFIDQEPDRPEGCYVLKGDIASLGTKSGNQGNGVDMSDPSNPREQVCKQADPKGQCVAHGEDCMESRCCMHPLEQCYLKNYHWAVCRPNCTKGIDRNDPEGYQTDWMCARAGTPPANPNKYLTPSLFCFHLVVLRYEFKLTQDQFQRHAGIFACNTWDVYSNQEFVLGKRRGKQANAKVLEGTFNVKLGGMYMTALNTQVFIQVWQAVFHDARFWAADWTAKLDVDTVFLPWRLRMHLTKLNPNEAMYLNNCKYGNHGPLEVISKAGMAAFSAGISKCTKQLEEEFREFGEDVFERHCLKNLAVRQNDDFNLLSEDHCDEQPFPCTSGKVAFHPFKNSSSHFKCLLQTAGASATESAQKKVLQLQAAVLAGDPAGLKSAIQAAKNAGVAVDDIIPAFEVLLGLTATSGTNASKALRVKGISALVS